MPYSYPFLLNYRFGCCGAPTTPLVYSEDLSIAQQNAHLFGLFKQYQGELDQLLKISDFKAFIEWLEGEEEAQTEIVEQYTDNAINDLDDDVTQRIRMLRKEIQDQFDDLNKSSLIWNPTKGMYDQSRETMRNLWGSLALRSMTVSQLNAKNWTVSDLASTGLTCNGLATVAGLMESSDFLATINGAIEYMPPQYVVDINVRLGEVEKNTGSLPSDLESINKTLDELEASVSTLEQSMSDGGQYTSISDIQTYAPSTNQTGWIGEMNLKYNNRFIDVDYVFTLNSSTPLYNSQSLSAPFVGNGIPLGYIGMNSGIGSLGEKVGEYTIIANGSYTTTNGSQHPVSLALKKQVVSGKNVFIIVLVPFMGHTIEGTTGTASDTSRGIFTFIGTRKVEL